MKKLIILAIVILAIGCTQKKKTVEIDYIKGGEIYSDTIYLDKLISENGQLQTAYIKQMSFETIDSAYFLDNNPDRLRFNSSPIKLDFTKPIQKYSPEYYTLATAYYVDKSVNYYIRVFNNKINFNMNEEYRNIKVLLGNFGLFTHPNQYILEENQQFSPSIFFHEIGHVAFWTLEDDLGIKFKGLSPLHMGLLEYFTVSQFNYPVVGELVLMKLKRDATLIYSYPQPDSMKLRRSLELMKESFPLAAMSDTNSIVSKYYQLSMKSYEKNLDWIVDNHRGGLLYTSTLWRIREQLGQEKTDKLVAETILNLNTFMEKRTKFYTPDVGEELKDKIMWYDLLYGLIKKDEALFGGKDKSIIIKEFWKSNFPVDKIKVANNVYTK